MLLQTWSGNSHFTHCRVGTPIQTQTPRGAMQRPMNNLKQRMFRWSALAGIAVVFIAGSRWATAQEPVPVPPDDPLEVLVEPVPQRQTGRIVKIEAGKVTLERNDNNEKVTVLVPPDAKIVLNKEPAELKDLKPGDFIQVTSPPGNASVAVDVVAARVKEEADQPDQAPAPGTRERERERPRGRDRADLGRGGLGVVMTSTPGGAALILGVRSDTPAQQAGIIPGDFVMRFADKPVESARVLLDRIQEQEPGEPVEITISRRDEMKTAKVVLTDAQRARDAVVTDASAYLAAGAEFSSQQLSREVGQGAQGVQAQGGVRAPDGFVVGAPGAATGFGTPGFGNVSNRQLVLQILREVRALADQLLGGNGGNGGANVGNGGDGVNRGVGGGNVQPGTATPGVVPGGGNRQPGTATPGVVPRGGNRQPGTATPGVVPGGGNRQPGTATPGVVPGGGNRQPGTATPGVAPGTVPAGGAGNAASGGMGMLAPVPNGSRRPLLENLLNAVFAQPAANRQAQPPTRPRSGNVQPRASQPAGQTRPQRQPGNATNNPAAAQPNQKPQPNNQTQPIQPTDPNQPIRRNQGPPNAPNAATQPDGTGTRPATNQTFPNAPGTVGVPQAADGANAGAGSGAPFEANGNNGLGNVTDRQLLVLILQELRTIRMLVGGGTGDVQAQPAFGNGANNMAAQPGAGRGANNVTAQPATPATGRGADNVTPQAPEAAGGEETRDPGAFAPSEAATRRGGDAGATPRASGR
ncbi:MAG: PDZ domain-containing protein [Planctomycetes bacterium]|nr:PDZ domain-containing protein [Planctomycetota bacterium]